jgi:hypothetical protein
LVVGVTLNPTIPQNAAGILIDPPMSEPIPTNDPPVPIKAPSPPDDPPLGRSLLSGFEVEP